MKLSQALKVKNRLAGEVSRLNQILQRENSRRNDNQSTVDREAVWMEIQKTSEELGVLKGRISQANVSIYPKLERMGELKARIAFINSLPKRQGEEVQFIGRDQEKLVYNWDVCIGQERADALVVELQKQIEVLQDEVDAFNATTEI